MARVRMVTRTVDVTVAEVMCLEVNTAEVTVQEFELSGKFSGNDEILKQVKKAYETETFKPVSIQNVSTKEILYGMPEIEFIKLAKILPPRGTKEDKE